MRLNLQGGTHEEDKAASKTKRELKFPLKKGHLVGTADCVAGFVI